MKWIPNKTFPHPVLSPVALPPDRDNVNREFQATLDLSPTTGEQAFCLTVHYALSEKSLLDLIAKGKAEYATEIHCRETFMRRLIRTDKTKNSINFEKGDLNNWVEVSSYVVCTTDKIKNHSSDTFHPEFGNNPSFPLNNGDVLAVVIPQRYFISPDPQRAMGTIFQLESSDQQEKGVFAINLEDDKIKIIMHKDDATIFQSLQRNKKAWPVLLSSVYLSAVCEALRIIQQGDEPDAMWVGVVYNALKNENIEINSNSDLVKEAQKLLKNPISNMLTSTG